MGRCVADDIIQVVKATVARVPNGARKEAEESVVELIKALEEIREANKVLANPDKVFTAVINSIRGVDEKLADFLDSIDDNLQVKATILNYKSKLKEQVLKEQSSLNKLVTKLEKLEADKGRQKAAVLYRTVLKKIVDVIKAYQRLIEEATLKLSSSKETTKPIIAALSKALSDIKRLEESFETEENTTKTDTVVGSIKQTTDGVYGGTVVDFDGNTVRVENNSKSINEAIAKFTRERKNELAGTLAGSLIDNFVGSFPGTIKGKMFRVTKPGVFGTKNTNIFNEPIEEVLKVLPVSFTEFFAKDDGGKAELSKDLTVMRTFVNSFAVPEDFKYDTKVGITKEGLVWDKKVMDNEGTESNFRNALEVLLGKTDKALINPEKKAKLLQEYKGPDKANYAKSLDTFYVIPEHLQTMTKFYVAKMLSDIQSLATEIASKDDLELAKMGITGEVDQEIARSKALHGEVPISSVRGDIGKAMYGALGLTLNDNVPEVTKESLISGLSLLVQKTAESTGMIETELNDEGNIKYARVDWDKVTAALGEDGRHDLNKAINKLQYINEGSTRKRVTTKPVVDEDTRLIMNSIEPMSESSKDFINTQQAIGYKFNKKLDKWVSMDTDKVLKSFGWKDTESKSMHITEKQKQVALNDKIEREWETLKMYHASLGTGTEFFLPWGQTVSKRYTLITDLNYQESKMMREFMTADGVNVELNLKDVEQMNVFKAAVGQGLDLDPDKVSKKTMIAEFDKRIVISDDGVAITAVDPILQEAFETMNSGEYDADKISALFHEAEGYHAISAVEALVDIDKAVKAGVAPRTSLKFEVDAITSGMILTLLQLGTDNAMRLAEKGGIYTPDRLKVHTKYVKHWLGDDVDFDAGALIEAGKVHASAIENGDNAEKLKGQETDLTSDEVFKDLYSAIGVAMVEEVKATKVVLQGKAKDGDEDASRQLELLNEIGELNLKNVRKIAKSPVMVYIYGASVGSIKKKLAYSLGIDTLVKAIKENYKLESKVVHTEKEAARKAELEMFIGYYTQKPRYIDIQGKKLDKKVLGAMSDAEKAMYLDVDSAIELMSGDVNATFGKGIEASFKATFKEVDDMRDMTKSVELLTFEVYKARLGEMIKSALVGKYGDQPKGKGTDKAYALSKDDLKAINDKLVTEGFGHDVIWYKDNEKDIQPLYKKDSRVGGLSTGLSSLASDTSEEVFENSTATIKTGEEIANTGASSTIPIHAIDANLMLETLSKALSGSYVGENVYDAIILSIDKARLDATANTYNTQTVEQGFNRSILVDNFRKLENMLSHVEMTPALKKSVVLALTRTKGDANYKNDMQRLHLSMNKMLERLSWYKAANLSRVANSDKDLVSDHSHISNVKPSLVKAGKAKLLGDTTKIEALITFVRDKDRVNGYDYVLDLSSREANARPESLLFWDSKAKAQGKAGSKWDYRKASVTKLATLDRVLIRGGDVDDLDTTTVSALKALVTSGAEIVVENSSDELNELLGKVDPKAEDVKMKQAKVAQIIEATKGLPIGVRNKALAIINKHKCN